MKKLLALLLLAVFFLPSSAVAGDFLTESAVTISPPTLCEVEGAAEQGDTQELAQQGCCSWHDGVCGCSNGRVKCCDGTLSPSCTCHQPTPPSSETEKGDTV